MRCNRRLLPLLLAGLGLGVGVAACDDGDADHAEGHPGEHVGPPIPPAPPAPPPPPPALPPADGLSTDYFEVPDDGAARLAADLDLALGHVSAARAEAGYLFQAEVALPAAADRRALRPRFSSTRDGDARRVSLRLDEAALSPRGVRRAEGARWRLYLPAGTPTDLDLKLGAARADLDLTGVPLRRLRLDAGLTQVTLRFTEPNPVELEEAVVEAGLAEFAAEGLGHARVRALRFEGGAGRFALDFTGAPLLAGARADVRVGMADVTVTLPAGAPVVLDAPSSRFVSLRVPGAFVRHGSAWRSPEADGADAPFHLRIESGPGRVEVRLAE